MVVYRHNSLGEMSYMYCFCFAIGYEDRRRNVYDDVPYLKYARVLSHLLCAQKSAAWTRGSLCDSDVCNQ